MSVNAYMVLNRLWTAWWKYGNVRNERMVYVIEQSVEKVPFFLFLFVPYKEYKIPSTEISSSKRHNEKSCE